MILELANAQKDYLTGFYMKVELTPFLQRIKSEADKSGKAFIILMIDIDNFKSINDKYGHVCGDEVLKYFSGSLRLSLETKNGFIFRFGGDEFVIVFPEANSKYVFDLANQLEINIKNGSFVWEGHPVKLSLSGGIAMYPGAGKTIDKIIESADKAMYFSKRAGRGRITQYSKIKYEALKRSMLILCAIAALFLSLYLGARTIKSVNNYLQKISSSIRQKLFPDQFVTVYTKPSRIAEEGLVQDGQTLQRQKLSPGQYIRVYLNTGRVAEGEVVQYDQDKVSLKVKLADDDPRKVVATYKKEVIIKIKVRR